MSVKDMLLENGYECVTLLANYSYDTALIGISHDDRAIYDHGLMVEWLMTEEGCAAEDAEDWIVHNTIRNLPNMGVDGPIILHRFQED